MHILKLWVSARNSLNFHIFRVYFIFFQTTLISIKRVCRFLGNNFWVGINVDTPSIKENLKRRGITITNEIEIMINDLKLEIMGTGLFCYFLNIKLFLQLA
jgi:hypothetical protein